jgi:hypothetical protein
MIVLIAFNPPFQRFPRRDKVTGYRIKLHNEELHSLYSSPGIITMIKSRKVGLARMGKGGMHIGYWWESQKGREH